MPERLDASSCFVKTARARELLEQLKDAWAKIAGPNFLTSSFEREGEWHVARLRKITPIPSRASCIIGDIFHNIRSALDHLACLMVEASGGTVDRKTQFPIVDSDRRFAEVVRTQLPGLSHSYLDFVERLQPYSADAKQPSRLEVIHRLDIKDKHRALLVAAVLPRHVEFEATGRGAILDHRGPDRLSFPLEVGAEVLRLRLDPKTPFEQVNVRVKLAADIAFAETGSEHGEAVIPLLYELVRYVEEDVLRPAELLSVTS